MAEPAVVDSAHSVAVAEPAVVAERIPESRVQYVLFRISGLRLAAGVHSALRIVIPPAITRVPSAPDWIEGVANIEHEIVPVLDLRRRWADLTEPHDERGRLLLIEVNGQTLGLHVHGIDGVRWVAAEAVRPYMPDEVPGWPAGIVAECLVQDLWYGVLDLDWLIPAGPEIYESSE